MLLENNNKNFSFHFSLARPSSPMCAAQDGKNRLGPALRARAGRTQAATWAWAGKVALPRAPAWASQRSSRAPPSDRIGRPSVRFGRSKPSPRPVPLTLAHSLRRSLSQPQRLGSRAKQRASVGDRAKQRASGRWSEATMAPSPPPSPARVLPNG